ncbi:hypothetical protein GH714_013112 [Hevea brasiliensis]|uniref:Uncharacterized protein n=1 Tax=Hevea brasiliensis TaxID=3981 RepID=A0A6A6KP20_HEVBR|nr:hypothetical protein GH714_013112 [Hevea brasiliensis]
MNGFLHLGHAFSLSKIEFAAAYHRIRGANVLLPFAFHCTGMPIKASADKLRLEIQQFGDPPVFSKEVEQQVEPQIEPDKAHESVPVDKFKGKKSKAASKSGDKCSSGKLCAVLAFLIWQMRKLKSMGKIIKHVRYTIYSPLDGQPCADHDRASGEGVQPQEYTLIKMEVLPPFPAKLEPLGGKKIFLAAATLRPETMYGQTNAWLLPDGKYGAFEINETDIFILTERAALNLAYQNFSRFPQKPCCLLALTGYELIGLHLKSPLSFNKIIYALPMLTILTDKGAGIVTSVPSDAPDDYMALHDLRTKPALRENMV